MAVIKNYGLSGIGANVQMGKNGGYVTFTGGEFILTTNGLTPANLDAAVVSFSSLNDGVINITGFVDEDNMVSNSDTLVPTQQSVKSYIDSQLSVSGSSMNVAGDSGSGAVVFAEDTFSLVGATNEIETVFNDTTNTLTIGLPDDVVLANVTSTGLITFESIGDGVITVEGFVDEDTMVSDSNVLVPTQQSVKAYVDSQITAQDLDFQGDTGGTLSVDLDSQVLTIAGGTNISTSGSGQTLTVNLDSNITLNSVTAVSFDGELTGNITGSASTLETARNFSITGDGSAPAVLFDGSQDVTLTFTLANTAVTPGTYGSTTDVPVISVDSKGRVTSLSTAAISTSFTISGDTGVDDVVNAGEVLTFVGAIGQLSSAITNNTVTYSIVDGAVIANLAVTGTFTSDNITASDITVDGDTTITGNLTVQGQQIIVESTVTQYSDPALYLQGDTLTSDSGLDVGIHFNYWDSTAQEGFFGWDQSAKRFTFLTGVTESPDNIFSGTVSTVAANLVGNVTATTVSATGDVSFGTLTDTGESISIIKFVDEADGIANNDNDVTIPTSAAVIDYVANNGGDGLLLRNTFTADGVNSTFDIGIVPNVGGRTYYADKIVLKITTAFGGGSFNHILVRENGGTGTVLVAAEDADGTAVGTYIIEQTGTETITKDASIQVQFMQSNGTTPAVVTTGTIAASAHYNWV